MRGWKNILRLSVLSAAAAFILLPSFPSLADSSGPVIDEAGLFSREEQAVLEQEAAQAKEQTGMEVVILTIDDAEGKSAQDYADDYYDENGFGSGREDSGVLYLIDMDNREIALSALGMMSRYLTDERTGRILDQALEKVAAGDYAASAGLTIREICGYVEAGIPENHLYDPETGRSDYYRKRSITWYEALLAIAAAGAAAILPCAATVNRYKMKTQHRQALNYRMSYRADSAFAFRAVNDIFVNRVVTQRRIRRNTNGPGNSGGRSSGSSGRTTVHRSSSGRSHSGGSRKF